MDLQSRIHRSSIGQWLIPSGEWSIFLSFKFTCGATLTCGAESTIYYGQRSIPSGEWSIFFPLNSLAEQH
jgi:hypothetical protein